MPLMLFPLRNIPVGPFYEFGQPTIAIGPSVAERERETAQGFQGDSAQSPAVGLNLFLISADLCGLEK